MIGNRNNEQGVVLIAVVMMTLVMLILTISVVSLNVSQITATEREIKRIQAEMLLMGAVAKDYSMQVGQSAINRSIPTDAGTYGNVNYTISSTVVSNVNGNPDTVTATISY